MEKKCHNSIACGVPDGKTDAFSEEMVSLECKAALQAICEPIGWAVQQAAWPVGNSYVGYIRHTNIKENSGGAAKFVFVQTTINTESPGLFIKAFINHMQI